MDEKPPFWLRTSCASLVIGLPALGLATQPTFQARAAFWVGIGGLALLKLVDWLRRRD